MSSLRNKKIWVFNAGLSFEGNTKWLFMYIIKHRKDITPYWFCYSRESMEYIRKLGYKAYLFNSKTAQKIGSVAGVYVVNQNKEIFQEYFCGISILNLWHGVGCKNLEKNVIDGFMSEGIAKKNIRNKTIYKLNQQFLVTSPMMEKHFMEQCDVDEDKVIRAGYPCCFYTETVETFEHDILRQKGLPEGTKIAVYAPTYRDYNENAFFSTAIPDIERLIDVLEQTGYMMIFKMHPKMANDFEYRNIREKYLHHPRLLFWDNLNDFYEIMDKIDLAIIDYSSIFYDMLAKGVKHFARYIFDYESGDSVRDFAFDYKSMTYGKICNNFQELLDVFTSEIKDEPSERERIYNLFWSYEKGNSFETIINSALLFNPDTEKTLPTLYSFDIFDTLIGRTTLLPEGVFRYVQEKMSSSDLDYPEYFKKFFYKIRPWSEKNCREYYRKSQLHRHTDQIEITFDMIYEHIKTVYNLTDEQAEQLKYWELECEYLTSIPYEDNINLLKELINKGEKVILISDMYLPLSFIKKLLAKADPVLSELPVYLSNEYGVQKTTKKLFLKVYHDIDYQFGEWIHYGDNLKADGAIPRQLCKKTVNHKVPKLNRYESQLNNFINTYDGYQMSGLFARFRSQGHTSAEIFAYCYASLYWVPYIEWVINHAMERGIKSLYFISRDGFYLKQVADVLIHEHNLNIKTKYIYGSRKAWRIPSQIGNIEEDFFSEYGNFAGIKNYTQLLSAGDISDNEFQKMFPELGHIKKDCNISPGELRLIRETMGKSQKYKEYLLKKAEEKRKIIIKYLKQEIDFSEKYAFVEFWGRGYTQTCLAKLIWNIQKYKSENIFYYVRSIYPTENFLKRYNFSVNTYPIVFIETLFSNIPYKSIENYITNNGVVEPILVKSDNNEVLHTALKKYLLLAAKDYANLDFLNRKAIGGMLYDFALSYFYRFPNDAVYIETISNLKFSEAAYAAESVYAPVITLKTIINHFRGRKFKTNNKKMSLQKSLPVYRLMYRFYCKYIKGTRVGNILTRRLKSK